MRKLKLTGQASEIVRNLINSKDSEKVGYIAAVDPQTGEIFYGKNIVEAAKEGRKIKNDNKAVFFFVRIGYPSVHILKGISLRGYIEQEYFPIIKGCVHDKYLHLVSSPSKDVQNLDFIVDTGFSGYIVLDTKVIQSIVRDYLGEDTVTLAGNVNYSVSVYLSDITVNSLKLNEVEITEIKGEYLIGIMLMRAISKRTIFAFDSDEIIFEE